MLVKVGVVNGRLMGKRENKIETLLNSEIEKLGGKTYKWKSPQNAGVSDRIVILPFVGIMFAEVKTDDGKESPIQKRVRAELVALKCECRVIYGEYGVKTFIAELKGRLGRI